MPRYIDTDILQKFLEDEIEATELDKENSCGDEYYEMAVEARECAFREVISKLKTEPKTDVQGVKHGKWLRVSECPKSWTRACSVCGERAYMIRREYPYCPNCSAKMDCSAKMEKSE